MSRQRVGLLFSATALPSRWDDGTKQALDATAVSATPPIFLTLSQWMSLRRTTRQRQGLCCKFWFERGLVLE